MPETPRFAYVGCRTTRERNARGEGISVFALPADGGAWRLEQLVAGVLNPSFLIVEPKRSMLYAVHGDSSEASAYRIDPATGRLSFVNQAFVKGKNPVHLAVDRSNRFLVVANHVTAGDLVSSLAVLALREDGGLGEMTDHVPLTGVIGPHRVEQPFAKPHQVMADPSGRWFAVPDKGLDVTACWSLDDHGKLTRASGPAARAREGAGPRHAVFHPNKPFAYIVDELSSTLTACRFDAQNGGLTPFQLIPSLPDNFVGFSRAAEIDISPDGRFVYASNRGFDSIGAFNVDQASGRLTPRGWSQTLGKTPRFFALSPDGATVYAANEDSDSIVRLTRRDDGQLESPITVARTGSPTCILFS